MIKNELNIQIFKNKEYNNKIKFNNTLWHFINLTLLKSTNIYSINYAYIYYHDNKNFQNELQ